ncbi:hypothetical protein AAC387_Pa08g1017 [Persea americana]
MGPSPSTRFIDAALFNSGPLALSYRHELKWIIREHLINLLNDFPSLTPSTDTFTHDDGTSVRLLNAGGELHVSPTKPPISLTIWLHQCYPCIPPLVFLSSTSNNPVVPHHPFVDASGAATLPYLHNWVYPRSNLVDLVRNLVRIFSQHFPFFFPSCNLVFSNPFLASRREALDRLVGLLHCDVVALQAQAEQDIEDLTTQQGMLLERATMVATIVEGLEIERLSLKRKALKMAEGADVIQNWLRVNDQNSIAAFSGESLEAFEAADDESKQVLECMAANHAIDDVVYALDRALEEGVIPFGVYLKQVRALAKEQFIHRALLVKLRGSNWLNL